MPQIVVMTDAAPSQEATVLLLERVTPSDLDSDHFSSRLVERLGWALVDADEFEHSSSAPPAEDRQRAIPRSRASKPVRASSLLTRSPSQV
ncbi:MAG: hypothetical protein ACRDLL_04025 [Solirubrobacterales bacterium]